jgi:spermidine synthase
MDARLGLLLACFFLSGFAALLYQTAWTRELSFVFGTSELAVAAVLAAYMGGLALGAAAAARYALRLRRPVLAYGVLELAIAVSALSVPAGIRLINTVYVGLLGGASELQSGTSLAALFQLGAAFAVLLPPTAFMGATLPLLARHAVRREAEIGSRVGLLYAVNTAGAIAGTVCAAFWLMPELGLRRTVWAGAALNGVVFALAALLARGAAALPAAPPEARGAPGTAVQGFHWILPAIALSGAVSFAYEVLWTRLLGHLIGASVQAFATMLASFLLGIALGSAVAARLATSRERAALGFGVSQLGIALSSYAALAFADQLPELSRRLGAGPDQALASAAVAAAPLLPITLCIGATFPFAVRLLAQLPEQAAGATARVYAWNTLGAIAGALGAGFVLLPALGFEGTLCVGVTASLALAALAALAVRPRRTALAALAAAAGVALVALPPPPPWALLSSSPLSRRQEPGEVVYAAVGRSSSVMLFDQNTEFRLTSNGLPESMIQREGMLLDDNVARWLCLLPPLVRPGARELLVVGFGGGMALEAVPSSIAQIDVIELESEVLAANRKVGALRAIDPLADARLRVHIGDARGALQLTGKRYDAIVSQPSHPWTAGASHLYTREFFSLVRSRLAQDGVFVQWIGLGFIDEPLLRSLVATLLEAFPYVEIYQPRPGGLLFAASDAPLGLAGAERGLRAAREDYARFGVHRLEDFAATRMLDDAGARALAAGAPPNTDDHNLLAVRAARLGKASLDGDATYALMREHDPLRAGSEGLDYPALLRGLVERGFPKRASSVALSRAGAEEELGLGWVELGLERRARAARHFARALALDPASAEARAGLVASRLLAVSRRLPVPELDGQELGPELDAFVAAVRHAEAGEWPALAALDAELGRIGPGDALFDEASRLRIRWRLEQEEPSAGAEALALADTLLSRRWRPEDALLRASAAVAADRPLAAWGALERIAEMPKGPQTRSYTLRALEIAEKLPEEVAGELRARLARRVDTRAALPSPP